MLFGVAPATAILRCGPFPLVFFLSYFFVHGNLFSRGERGRVSFWPLRSVRFGHVSFWGSCVNDLLGSLLQRLLFSAILCFDKHYKPSSKNSSTKLFFPSCFVCSSKGRLDSVRVLQCGESFHYKSADMPLTSADSSGSATRC